MIKLKILNFCTEDICQIAVIENGIREVLPRQYAAAKICIRAFKLGKVICTSRCFLIYLALTRPQHSSAVLDLRDYTTRWIWSSRKNRRIMKTKKCDLVQTV